MATYIPYTPNTAVGKALFNFDVFGIPNYRLFGVVRVSVSDTFSLDDFQSTSYSNFLSSLYTSGRANEVPWDAQMLGAVQDVLSIFSQFANIKFQWQGDYDSIGADSTANPEDIGRGDVSDINITWMYRTDVDFSGISGGSSDSRFFNYIGAQGDIFLNAAFLPFSLAGNTYSKQTLIHELGHSLGLSHPHNGFDYTTFVPTITQDFAVTKDIGFDQLGFNILSAVDMYKEYFTVMAYDDQRSTLPGSTLVYQAFTPMILDVIALQQAYGEGAGTSGSDNDTIQPGTAGYRTYFDIGGTDTIDLIAYLEGAYLNMGVSIVDAAHLVGISMGLFDADVTLFQGRDPANLRWFYGEYENAIGSSSDDLIIGNVLNNIIGGLDGNDVIFGEGGHDSIAGGNGNDVLSGGPGSDFIDGGAGTDTATWIGSANNYALGNADGLRTVQDQTGNEGTDTLANVERLEFSDVSVALDISGSAGTVAKTLGAVFGKASVLNMSYVGIGLNLMDAGMRYEDLMLYAINAKLGLNPSDVSVVNLLYVNVVGVAPGAGDLATYLSLLDSTVHSQATLGVFAADTSINAVNVDLIGLVQTGLEYV